MYEWFIASAGKFHGLDWAAMTFTFLQLYTLGSKKRYGFLLGIGANVSWLAFGLVAGSIPQIVANVVFIIMNLRGYVSWSLDTGTTKTKIK